jgi:peptidyl-Lys metalloendopeptidase
MRRLKIIDTFREEEMQTENQMSQARKTLYGVTMVLVILSALGALDLPIACAQDALNGAVVSLSSDRASFGAGGGVIVHVGITNPNSSSIRILKWYTPLDGVERPLFTVLRNRRPVSYIGSMVKRAAPTDKDYITLLAGESLTSDVDLAAYYDLSASGRYAVQYNVTASGFSAKGSRERSQRTDYMVSNMMELFIEGRAIRASQEPFPEAVTGANGFVGCSASQQTSVVSARNAASTYATDAGTYLTAGTNGSRYTTWFGAYDASRYNTVKNHFNSLQNAVGVQSMTFDCSTCPTGQYADAFAYVYPNSPYTVYLCGAFWTAATTGTDSKAGTLIHETSHFTVVAGTSDYVYGQTGAKALAISNPSQAIMNADSHEYFAENTPSIPSCPDLYSWNGVGFVNNGSLYKKSHSPEQESYQELVVTQPVVERDNALTFVVKEVDDEESHINSVDMYYRNSDAAWKKLDLLSAIHNRAGDVKKALEMKDEARTITVSGDEILLTYGIPSEGVGKYTEFMSISSGYYLWSAETWVQVLDLGPVLNVKPGDTVALQAKINNMSAYELPADAQVYFDIHGPGGYSIEHVLSLSAGFLAPGSPKWHSLDWTVPKNAPAGEYFYSVSIFVGEENITFWDYQDVLN